MGPQTFEQPVYFVEVRSALAGDLDLDGRIAFLQFLDEASAPIAAGHGGVDQDHGATDPETAELLDRAGPPGDAGERKNPLTSARRPPRPGSTPGFPRGTARRPRSVRRRSRQRSSRAGRWAASAMRSWRSASWSSSREIPPAAPAHDVGMRRLEEPGPGDRRGRGRLRQGRSGGRNRGAATRSRTPSGRHARRPTPPPYLGIRRPREASRPGIPRGGSGRSGAAGGPKGL